jgi:hypothetical protein
LYGTVAPRRRSQPILAVTALARILITVAAVSLSLAGVVVKISSAPRAFAIRRGLFAE